MQPVHTIPPTIVQREAPSCNGARTRCGRCLFTSNAHSRLSLPPILTCLSRPSVKRVGRRRGGRGCQYYTTTMPHCRTAALPHCCTAALLHCCTAAFTERRFDRRWLPAAAPACRQLRPSQQPPISHPHLPTAPPTRTLQPPHPHSTLTRTFYHDPHLPPPVCNAWTADGQPDATPCAAIRWNVAPNNNVVSAPCPTQAYSKVWRAPAQSGALPCAVLRPHATLVSPP